MSSKVELLIDFETRSELELSGKLSVGYDNYFSHSSTKILMMAWAFGEEDVQLWEPDLTAIPDRVRQAFEDPEQIIVAYASAFERRALRLIGYTIPVERFRDSQVSCRYLSMPGYLEDVCDILRLPDNLKKDKRGSDLINIFSKPSKTKPTKQEKKAGVEPKMYFRDRNTDPELWEVFKEYCKTDVKAEREVERRCRMLGAYPMPEQEQKYWYLDQKINDRGIPVNVDFVRKALTLAKRSKKEIIDAMNKLTGLKNANSVDQLLGWAQDNGYEGNSLRKEAVIAAIKYSTTISDKCRQAFEMRRAASSTTYTKLETVLRQVGPDNRLRYQFVFLGSSRCGRWAGSGFQFHNLARPDKVFEDLTNLDRARHLIDQMDYDGIVKEFGSVLLTVKNCIRTVFECVG